MGMAQGTTLHKVKTIVVETQIKNTQEFKELVENEFEFSSSFYVILIRNNDATDQYKGIQAVTLHHVNSYWIFDRTVNATNSISASWLFTVNINSIIEIYEVIA